LIEKYSDTPFCVRAISPAISALLFEGSSQDCVPGNERRVQRLAVFQRLDRLLRVDRDVLALVHHLAAERPHQPVAVRVAVAHRVPGGEARRVVALLQLLAKIQELVGVGRHPS